MVTIKKKSEIILLEEGGRILASILSELKKAVRPGISTFYLEKLARRLIKEKGARPSFLGYIPRGCKEAYPAALCVAVNDEVVHGLPSKERLLEEGDIVSLDLGIEYKGLYTDMALTVGVGRISLEAESLIKVTKDSLLKGIEVLKEGAALGDYGFVVQSLAEKAGFSVVKKLVGHGVGYAVHEEPDIPNWGRKGEGLILKKGMVLALEPMICQGKGDIEIGDDGWVWKTKDGLLSAHFEHTVVIEKNRARILTSC